MDMPSSRYKVVEQGRRLVVLDSWNGNAPVTGHVPAPVAKLSARPATVEQARATLRAHGGEHRSPPAPPPAGAAEPGVVVTQRWYDDKAPRRVRLRQSNAWAWIAVAVLFGALLAFVMFGWPVLLLAGFLIFQNGTRRAWRGALTKWLDGMDQLGPA